MVVRFTRWTARCGCCFELEIDEENGDTDNKFHMINSLCKRHKPLIIHKEKYRDNHSQLAHRTLNEIERIKRQNMERAIDAYNSAELTIHKKDGLANIELVRDHNNRITEEWQGLASRTYAYDSEVYDQVWQEQHEQ